MYSKKLIKQFSSGCFIANAPDWLWCIPRKQFQFLLYTSFTLAFNHSHFIVRVIVSAGIWNTLLLNTTNDQANNILCKASKTKLPVRMYWMYLYMYLWGAFDRFLLRPPNSRWWWCLHYCCYLAPLSRTRSIYSQSQCIIRGFSPLFSSVFSSSFQQCSCINSMFGLSVSGHFCALR